MKPINVSWALAIFCLPFVSAPAFADLVTFDFTYSGADYGNSAAAYGSVTLESYLIYDYTGNDPPPAPFSASQFFALSLTVTGASSGNGTFTAADITGGNFFYYDSPTPLPLSGIVQEILMGNGDFNFNFFNCGNTALVPCAFAPITLETAGGQYIVLTSLTPAPTPLPAAAWLLLSGLGGLGVMLRKRAGR